MNERGGGWNIGRAAAIAVGAASALAPVAAAAATASDLYYERTVMVAADDRCALFAPSVGAALAAAQAQARGAALRSGVSDQNLAAVEARARFKAGAAACQSPDLTTAAARVRTAFEGFAKISRMTYPGDTADWRADRTPGGAVATWRLSQDVRFGWDRMLFGIVGFGQARPLLAVASFADQAQPYAARLVIRDTTLTTGPFLNRTAADARGRLPLASRLPPRGATRVFSAEARSPAGKDLRAADMSSAWGFRFPAGAADALTGLDPRESVAVEFLFAGRNGDQVRTAYIEVGDFAAGRAFLKVPQR